MSINARSTSLRSNKGIGWSNTRLGRPNESDKELGMSFFSSVLSFFFFLFLVSFFLRRFLLYLLIANVFYLFRKTSAAKNAEVASLEVQTHLR